jgi:tRNA (guanine-N7-)-methyltransferase
VSRGRTTPAQKKALSTFETIPFSENALDFAALFGNNEKVFCEIGFGSGEAAAEIAANNPMNNYIGIEVFDSGVGSLLNKIEERGLKNIKLLKYDAVQVLEKMIPDNSISGFHIFFPDPWPKKRHHKRRLIQRPFTNLLASKLINGAYVYFASDVASYSEWALFELSNTNELVNKYESYSPRSEWRPVTKFEKRAINAGREIKELFFCKKWIANE